MTQRKFKVELWLTFEELELVNQILAKHDKEIEEKWENAFPKYHKVKRPTIDSIDAVISNVKNESDLF